MPDIRHLVEINSPANVVYRAVTEQAGLAAWWTPTCKAEPKVGAVLVFDFNDQYHNEMRVTNLVPDRRAEWRCVVSVDEWIATTITFDIQQQGDLTILRFSHAGWREATDFFAKCNYHWGYYMRSLKQYCETGQGTPYPQSG